MTKWMRAALAACLTAGALTLAACGGDSISNPTAEAPAPVAAAPQASNPTPAPNPSPTPEAGDGEENPGYLIEFENNAGFKVTNKTDIDQAYRAYITSFDNQELELAHQLSGSVPPEESWGGSFDRQCVQLDITQFGYAGLPLKGGAAFFDKDGKQFNPSRSPEKVAACRTTPCVPEWRRSQEYEVIYGPWSGPPSVEAFEEQTVQSCGTRSVTFRYTETNSCTRETRTVDVQQPNETKECEQSCEEKNPNPGAVNGSGAKTVTKHAGTPESAYWYWDMDNGQGNTPKQNACEGRGGVWLGDEYNIPNDGSNTEYDDVCRTTFDGLAGQPGVDADLIKKVVVSAAVPDKYSVSVSASFSVAAGSGGNYKFQIVYGANTVKKETSESLDCGEAFQGSLTWGPGDTFNNSPNYSANDGHVTGSYKLVILRNGVQVGSFNLP